MSTTNLNIAGRIIWTAELKETRIGSPMRGVLVAVSEAEQGQEPPTPPEFVQLFGADAVHVQKGGRIAAEGCLKASIGERGGKPRVRLSIMARWSRSTGQAGDRQRRSQAAKKGAKKRRGGDHQAVIDGFAPAGPFGPETPPSSGEITL